MIIASIFQFQQLEGRSLKNIRASTGFKPVTSTIPVRCLTQQIDLAPNEPNKLTSPPMCGFTAQLVQHRTVSQSSRVRIPLKPYYFSGFLLLIASIGKKLLRWSLVTFIYNCSTNMDFIYVYVFMCLRTFLFRSFCIILLTCTYSRRRLPQRALRFKLFGLKRIPMPYSQQLNRQ